MMKPNGILFDEYQSGQTFHTDRRTITETDHVNFTTAFGFFEPLFMDQAYVETRTPYKKRIVPGALTFSVAEGLTILSGILHGTGMALLGVDLNIRQPVFIGDTLMVTIQVDELRETSKPDRGIVTYTHRVTNQHEATVMEYTVKRMIRRRA
ncbi:MAG: MaoC family dehydratase N-terminal domain-containing protein [Desulfatitalea sp.]|nr:MaoC family dehydratase N-terminal domain-containing protein [Desulfatitalea sp.]